MLKWIQPSKSKNQYFSFIPIRVLTYTQSAYLFIKEYIGLTGLELGTKFVWKYQKLKWTLNVFKDRKLKVLNSK